MVALNVSATFEGKPLSVLGDLIDQRQRLLGESAEDAVVATGIDALLSLRALTRTAPRAIPRADVRFGREEPQYETYPRGTYRRMVITRWRNGKRVNLVKWQKIEGVTKTGRPRATAEDRRRAWQRWGKIGNRGLAKYALSVAMNKLSTRGVADKLSVRTSKLAEANVFVRKHGGAGAFFLEVHDAINYAALALKGGPGAVDVALAKAANKIAGRLSKVASAKFGEKIPTPFPEVKQRKAS